MIDSASAAHGPRGGGPLVTVETLRRELAGSEAPRVLDVQWTLSSLSGPSGAELYTARHLPGAVFVDLDRDLAAPAGAGGRHPLPEAAAFQAAMRAKGVSGERPVVVYDQGGGLSAARAWWLLRYYGHRDVRVLDGGIAAWEHAGGPVSRGEAELPPPGDFDAVPGHMPVLDADATAALARTGVLLDARAPERFRGEEEPVDPVAGHIPGARNHPTALNLDSETRFLAPEELAGRFAATGAAPGVEVGAYCGSGVTAAQLVLALEVAGIGGALYPGSWSEWITDPSRPVATGS